MSFIAGILTFIIILNCLLLTLLVLVQLPKKDAGAGLAFGGGAADALFGAGSGNVLTKVTKWATVIFLVLAVILGIVEDKLQVQRSGISSNFATQVQQKQQMQAPIAAPSAPVNPTPAVTTTNASYTPTLLTPTTLTNAPAASTPAK